MARRKTAAEMCEWLQSVLIPDCDESGLDGFVDTLEECCHIMTEQRERLEALENE